MHPRALLLSTEYDFGEDAGGQNRIDGGTRAVRLRGLSGGTLVNYRFNPPLEWILTTRFSY